MYFCIIISKAASVGIKAGQQCILGPVSGAVSRETAPLDLLWPRVDEGVRYLALRD